ncbi:MAG: (Na+)-NQR maturation NqrM [Moraxellaceae bacterium]|jgi:hypothetical protein|nr:(Na+)-NQR maturation NqrM [Moraxellaceae bacterium]HQV80349.1 (Na+)-NQR maturation NqrM [Agitococcus sp.]MBK7298967.1 (Na+)-NQR maturation NqrM [Moraxellaceae bacterium]MBK8327729.1 (Na+)-NQR maturation NqrM [Moraxellaceae bacterium]MBK9185597.1 (Na+)-NQR maturation NqrM [Moraxellaceae bacterium]
MTIFLVSLVAIVLMIVLMAVGVMMGKEPLKGTCGGLNRIMGDRDCPVCGGDTQKCDSTENTPSPLIKDAMK